MLFAVEIFLDKDVKHFKRSIYTFLDLLGDVGGLNDALSAIASVIIALNFSFFGNPIHEHILNALFIQNQNSDKKRNRQ